MARWQILPGDTADIIQIKVGLQQGRQLQPGLTIEQAANSNRPWMDDDDNQNINDMLVDDDEDDDDDDDEDIFSSPPLPENVNIISSKTQKTNENDDDDDDDDEFDDFSGGVNENEQSQDYDKEVQRIEDAHQFQQRDHDLALKLQQKFNKQYNDDERKRLRADKVAALKLQQKFDKQYEDSLDDDLSDDNENEESDTSGYQPTLDEIHKLGGKHKSGGIHLKSVSKKIRESLKSKGKYDKSQKLFNEMKKNTISNIAKLLADNPFLSCYSTNDYVINQFLPEFTRKSMFSLH